MGSVFCHKGDLWQTLTVVVRVVLVLLVVAVAVAAVVAAVQRRTLANIAEDSFSPLFRSRGPGSAIIEALRIVNSEENLILTKSGKLGTPAMQTWRRCTIYEKEL